MNIRNAVNIMVYSSSKNIIIVAKNNIVYSYNFSTEVTTPLKDIEALDAVWVKSMKPINKVFTNFEQILKYREHNPSDRLMSFIDICLQWFKRENTLTIRCDLDL